MTRLSCKLSILKPMLRLSVFIVLSLLLGLSSCRSPDPDAGIPLKLNEQVSLQAFKRLEPTSLAWSSLMPADYTPSYQEFPWAVEDGESLMQQTLAETPLVEDLNGQDIKVSGYVVPLDGTDEAISEFLLVPFLGACVHVPPPPANQIVYVKPKYPLLMDESWDIISVVGKMTTEGKTSDFGAAGYQMIDPILMTFDESEYAGIVESPVVVDGMSPDQPLTLPLDIPVSDR